MKPIYTRNRIIGLLGGSFNPAHGGHLHITQHALKKYKLDAVWWLVSPHNPLKSSKDLGDYSVRFASAKKIAGDRRIHVSDIEKKIGAKYSWQTIAWLKRHHAGAQFVWLMGADNLAQFHRWRRWQKLLADLPILVLDRAPYSHTALRSKAHLRMQRFWLKDNHIDRRQMAPSLRFEHMRRDPLSSTALRKKLGNGPILGHNKVTG